MPADLGLFMPKTRRLHPRSASSRRKCSTSRSCIPFRLRPIGPYQVIPSSTNPGLYFVPVYHQGNCNYAREEVEVIARIVESLLKPEVLWLDGDGRSAPLNAKKTSWWLLPTTRRFPI